MAVDDDQIASLRLALADMRQVRDEALAAAAGAEQRRQHERMAEMHRVRNLYSVVRVIARRTADEARTVEDYCGTLDGRLSAYLGVHAATARDWRRGSDLALLVSDQLLTFGLREGEGVELIGPPVSVTSWAAAILALAFHELVAAAILSGGLGHHASRLCVRWSVGDGADPAGGRGLAIDWVESPSGHDGAGRPPTSWARWIEQAIAYQLSGTLRFGAGPAGASATFRLPWSVVAQDADRER